MEKAITKEKRWRLKHPQHAWAIASVNSAKLRAKQAGLPFNITVEYVLSLVPDICPVFSTSWVYGEMSCDAPSLDRLDPMKGYVEGNVAVISVKANRIKNKYKSKDLYKVADWLYTKGY